MGALHITAMTVRYSVCGAATPNRAVESATLSAPPRRRAAAPPKCREARRFVRSLGPSYSWARLAASSRSAAVSSTTVLSGTREFDEPLTDRRWAPCRLARTPVGSTPIFAG